MKGDSVSGKERKTAIYLNITCRVISSESSGATIPPTRGRFNRNNVAILPLESVISLTEITFTSLCSKKPAPHKS